jgi:tetratricopeptide (TPR) repeat protein
MNETRLAQLKALLQSEPGDPFLVYGVAQEYVSGGDHAAARPWFEQLVKEHPDYVPTYYHYGLSLYHLEELETAIEVWKKGVEVASASGDRKTVAEIKELLEDLGDEDDEDW